MNTQANTVVESTSFTPFTNERKSLIAHLKTFLMATENRPYRTEEKVRVKMLFLKDYAVYAALRGADYRKTSHMENGENAKAAIKDVISSIESFKTESLAKRSSLYSSHFANRYLPADATPEHVAELKAILVAAVA